MTGRTHDLAAATLLIAVVVYEPIHTITLSTAIAALLANQIGGIAPDIDQPTAPFWRNLPIGGMFGRFFDKMLGGHRFLTHSLLGAGLMCYLVRLLLQFIHPLIPHVDIQMVWLAFIIGVISHLVMDTFTKEGVPWLLPIPIKFGIPPIRRFRVTAGKSLESLVVFPGLAAIAIWLCASHYHYLVTLIHSRLVQ